MEKIGQKNSQSEPVLATLVFWRREGLFFGAELFFKFVHEVVEGFNRFRAGRLLALHRCDDDFMAKSELFEVGLFVRFCSSGLETLS